MISRGRAWLNTAITLVGVITIALLGLVLEDMLPRTMGEQRVFDHVRIGAGAFFLSSLLALVYWRSRIASAYGTLYHMTFLGVGMPETHTLELLEHVPKHPNAKRLSRRWLVPEPDAHPRVCDLASEVQDMARTLQVAMNEDDVSTGYHLAPDLLFPIALAFGYELTPWANSTLDELHKPTNPREPAFAPHVDRWRLGAASKDRSPVGTRSVGPVGVATSLIAELSPGSSANSPWIFATKRDVRVAVFASPGGDVHDTRRPVVLAECKAEVQRGFVVVSAPTMVDELAASIRAAVHDGNGEPVLLAFRVPKTVALAVGHALRTTRCGASSPCTESRCINVWEVLVPLHFVQRATGNPYIPLRVHPDQPPLDEMQVRIDRLVTA